MRNRALNTCERILLKVPTSDGFEYLDPRVVGGATFKDIADEATAHGATQILRFDMDTLTAVDITDTVAPHFDGDFDGDLPVWLQNSALFGSIVAEARRDAREHRDHQRSFSHASNFL